MSEQAVESPLREETFLNREIGPLVLRNSSTEDLVCEESDSGLKELVKAAPFSPGKQPFDLSLRDRLAYVDNSYSGSLSNFAPIAETNDAAYWLANERPMSPDTDSTSSSSRSTAPSPPTTSCLLDEDDIHNNGSPRIISDTSSEPSSDTGLLISPPSARRPTGCSPNRPVVHLNLSNNSLKSSSGSSPFREGKKYYTRTKSVPQEVSENTNNDNGPVQRALFV